MRTEFDLYIAPDGEEYDLSDWSKTFILNSSGHGMSPIEYRTSRGPFQSGETPLDYVLRPRIIQYIHRFSACNRAEYWTERERIQNLLRPNRQIASAFNPGVLRKIRADGTKRDLSVFIADGPTFTQESNKWDEWGSTHAIRFIAHDPVYFAPTINAEIFSLASLTQLVFPITFPIWFGSSQIDDTVAVTYTGTWLSYPTIVITGPIGSPTIYNNTTGEMVGLTYDVPSGRIVTINLNYGYKTVEDDTGANLIGTLDTNSDFATFHIAPDPEAPGGINQIRVTGTQATNATAVAVRYYTRFIGV